MLKKIYVLLWFLMAGSLAASAFTGTLTDLGVLAYALVGLALIYGLALWAVLVNPGDTQPE